MAENFATTIFSENSENEHLQRYELQIKELRNTKTFSLKLYCIIYKIFVNHREIFDTRAFTNYTGREEVMSAHAHDQTLDIYASRRA